MAGRDLLGTVPESLRPVLAAYASGQPVANDALYDHLAPAFEADPQRWAPKRPAPPSCRDRNLAHRTARWAQQSLKALGLLEKVPGERGVWRLAPKARELTPAQPGMVMLAFSTKLGLALWGSCHDVFNRIDEPVALCLTSPPFPIRKGRAYGTWNENEIVDFILRALEPIVANLVDGGTIALNVSQDCFVEGTPARSCYLEECVLAVRKSLGLHVVERLIWTNPARPPGPVRWASITRQALSCTYDPVYIFTNNPLACRADNRRVLQPHTERHKAFVAAGGEARATHYGDGAFRLRQGSFSAQTPGRIPRNVQNFTHNSSRHREMRRAAIEAGLPTHGASMPLGLAKFLVEFLTRKDDLVVDCFGGWLRTALAAEELGRRWICTELMGEYIAGAAHPFRNKPGFSQNFQIA